MYGVDANGDGLKDPYNPVDAIFAAGRYLKAAGASKDIRRAIFAYNHATWYVDSVMLRAKLIGGMPPALVDSLTTLTQGHFPVAAKSTYADDLSPRAVGKKRIKSGNAAVIVQSSTSRSGIDIFSKRGAPVIAVNDSVVKQTGTSKRLGRYVVLQDVAGNRYRYSHLGRVAASVPQPKPVEISPGSIKSDLEQPANDRRPSQPASAGAPPKAIAKATSGKTSTPKAGKAKVGKVKPATTGPVQPTVVKERLFAHPSRPHAMRAGGQQQLLSTGRPVAGFKTFEAYFNDVLGLKGKDVVLKKMRPGVQIVAGTIIGRIDQIPGSKAPHVHFEVIPTGAKAPIDPKVLLDGWNLLASTAIYRAAGKSAFFGPNSKNASIGQLLLMPKSALQQRILADPRVSIYPCGRRDVRAGQIDRRVLLTLEYLASSGMNPTVTSLRCGHGFLTASGNVSEHSSGNAVDIAAINGVPITGHQGRGSITEMAIRRLGLLQGNARPHQIISLMTIPGLDNTMSLPDHYNHIHVGFHPLYGSSPGTARQYNAVLKPGQWIHLINRLGQIDNPVVPVKPSKYSIKVSKGSSGHLRAGD
jgi:murein DD-endopeptidase MepM/ murein hydrolase activator NlpD